MKDPILLAHRHKTLSEMKCWNDLKFIEIMMATRFSWPEPIQFRNILAFCYEKKCLKVQQVVDAVVAAGEVMMDGMLFNQTFVSGLTLHERDCREKTRELGTILWLSLSVDWARTDADGGLLITLKCQTFPPCGPCNLMQKCVRGAGIEFVDELLVLMFVAEN